MKWVIVTIMFIICSLFLFGCRDSPIGYSIYNKVVMEEPSKLSYAYDAGNYKYTYMNGSEVKITLLGIEIPQNNKCEQMWRMKGVTYAQENIAQRIVKIQFVKDNLVYISYEGEDVGLMLIKEGYAKASSGNYSKHDEYVAAENYAKSQRNGMWGCE